jgi:hypothetical protein
MPMKITDIQKKNPTNLFPSDTTGIHRSFRSTTLVDQIANALKDDILAYKEDFRNSLKIHRRILELFKKKNVSPEEIEKLVRRHIEIALEPFLASMEKLEGKVSKQQFLCENIAYHCGVLR